MCPAFCAPVAIKSRRLWAEGSVWRKPTCRLNCDGLDDASTLGLEMIELIRKEDRLKGTPIILLTAKTDEPVGGTECGADAYLAKPFDRELKAEVRNLQL